MDYKTTLDNCGCLGVAREVRAGEDKYACYTRFSESDQGLIIGVSDGETVWRVAINEEELSDRCGAQDKTSYLSDLSQDLRDGEVCVSQSGHTLTLSCRGLVTFTLSKDDTCGDLRHVLFHVVHELQSTRTKLKECEKQLELSRKQAAADKPVYADVTMRSSSSKMIGRPKRATGASLINPSSKRRKAATGVVFDSNSQADS